MHEWPVSLIILEACPHPPNGLLLAHTQREVSRVPMGLGAPTQQLSHFTGPHPSARLGTSEADLGRAHVFSAAHHLLLFFLLKKSS